MKKFKLAELFDMQMGKTPARNKSDYWNCGTNPWISIADMSLNGKYITTTKETITDKAVDETGIKPIYPGTVIMSFKLSVGKVARTTVKSYSNEAIMAFEIKDVEPSQYTIDNEYAYYLLSSLNFDNIGNKAVMGKTLNKAILQDTTVCVHRWDEQRKIIAKLDKVNELIDLRKQQLSKLDEFVKARFVEMFGDILSDNNLPLVKLKELADIGSSKRIYANEYVDSGVPFYRSKEIRELGTGLKPSFELFIKQERYDEIKEKYGVPKIGDILIAAIGATIGYSWIVDTDKPFYYKDGNLIILSTKNNVNPIFLNHTIGILIEDFKSKGVAGSAQLALTIEKLEKIQVVNPNIELQNKFAAFVKQTDKSKLSIQQSLEKLETLKKSLMQQYFG